MQEHSSTYCWLCDEPQRQPVPAPPLHIVPAPSFNGCIKWKSPLGDGRSWNLQVPFPQCGWITAGISGRSPNLSSPPYMESLITRDLLGHSKIPPHNSAFYRPLPHWLYYSGNVLKKGKIEINRCRVPVLSRKS